MTAGAGDNVSAGGVAADQLCGYVSRVERLEGEISELNTDKSEIYKEAKAVGFDVKVLKMVVKRRRLERSDIQEMDQLVEFYESVVNGTLGKAGGEDDPLA
ncbi:MAG: DUF2312 domain-containing protein [Nitrospiraceae bacterium]